MAHTKRANLKLQRGDRVRFTAAFCRSTGQYAGPEAPASYGPHAQGNVTDEAPGLRNCVAVVWDDGVESTVNAGNLERKGKKRWPHTPA